MYDNIILEAVNNVMYDYSHRYRLWRSHQVFNVVFVGLLVQMLYILIYMLKDMRDIIREKYIINYTKDSHRSRVLCCCHRVLSVISAG